MNDKHVVVLVDVRNHDLKDHTERGPKCDSKGRKKRSKSVSIPPQGGYAVSQVKVDDEAKKKQNKEVGPEDSGCILGHNQEDRDDGRAPLVPYKNFCIKSDPFFVKS